MFFHEIKEQCASRCMVKINDQALQALMDEWPDTETLRQSLEADNMYYMSGVLEIPTNRNVYDFVLQRLGNAEDSDFQLTKHKKMGIFARQLQAGEHVKVSRADPIQEGASMFTYSAPEAYVDGYFSHMRLQAGNALIFRPHDHKVYTVHTTSLEKDYLPEIDTLSHEDTMKFLGRGVTSL